MLAPHTAAVIDNQPNSHCTIVVAKQFDDLLTGIFENLEVPLAKAFDEIAFPVEDGRLQDNHAHTG
jgi:hypothetical protein